MPAGKAIAIASMPTAILMGMGFTPTLANAEDGVTNPFKSGPCVTQQDESSEAESPSASESPDKHGTDSAEDRDKGKERDRDRGKDEGKGKGDTAEPTPTPSADSGSSSGSGSDDKAEPEDVDSATKEPSESESKNPRDPLGVGEALENVFTPDDKEESASPGPSPTPSVSAGGDSAEDIADKVTDVAKDTVQDTVEKAEQTTEDTADKAKEAAEGATATPSPSALALAGQGEDGKEAYPCVVEKKVDGKDETTPVTLPVEPWYLESSGLLLDGLDYQGVVNVTTADGTTKQVLEFTVEKVDIGDLHQTVKDPRSGKTYHAQAAKGSTSTIRGGTVTMYTEKLQGNLFGLIPVTFDPEHPPPINTPIAYFTKVKITQAGQFGGDLTVPGLHQYVTD